MTTIENTPLPGTGYTIDTPPVQGPLEGEVSTTPSSNGSNQGYPCPRCDRVFDSPTALAVHSRAHLDKVPCPDCGEFYMPGPGMSAHRKARHGVPGATSVAPFKGKRKECPECGRNLSAKDMSRHRRVQHGVGDERERPAPKKRGRPPKKTVVRHEEWNADDIFKSVVGVLWPKGDVPADAIVPLIHWREATAKMLEEVGR